MHFEFRHFNTNLKKLTLCVSVILLLFLSTGSIAKVSAQNPPLMSTSPEPALIYLNGTNQVVVDILITDAVDIIAFDFILNWDPAIATRISIAPGSFLGSNVSCTYPPGNNIPGRTQMVCTALIGQGFSGPGVLARITFSGVDYGSTALTFTKSQLTNYPDYGLILAQRDHGQINTTYQAGTVVNSSLSGEVSLQGQPVRGGIPMTLLQGLYLGYGPYPALSLEQPGINLIIPSLVMDAYPITTIYPYYLNLDVSAQKIKGIVGTADTLAPLLLLAGNVVDSDNEINSEDMDLIKNWFDLTLEDLKSGDPLLGDANFDGVVDIRDLALAGGNFGLNGTTAYEAWLP